LVIVSAVLGPLRPNLNPGAPPETQEVIAVDARQDLKTLRLSFPLDLCWQREKKYIFWLKESISEPSQESGYAFSLETERFEPRRRINLRRLADSQGGLNGAYHSSQELAAELKSLAASYPALARLYIPGKSLENRNIYALKISDHPG